MVAIAKNILKHLASLSRLELTDIESAHFIKDFKHILGFIKKLETVDAEGVESIINATNTKNILREDEVNLDRRARAVDEGGRIISAFPQSERGHLKVPKIL